MKNIMERLGSIMDRLGRVSGAAALLLCIYTSTVSVGAVVYTFWPVDKYSSIMSVELWLDHYVEDDPSAPKLRMLAQEHMSRTGKDYFIYDLGKLSCADVPQCAEQSYWLLSNEEAESMTDDYLKDAELEALLVEEGEPVHSLEFYKQALVKATAAEDADAVEYFNMRLLQHTYEVRDEDYSREWNLQGPEGYLGYTEWDEDDHSLTYAWGIPAAVTFIIMLLNYILLGTTRLRFWRTNQ